MNEECDCGRQDRVLKADSPVPAADSNNRMFQSMLCSQLLKAKNPHCLKAGALNDMQDEDEGGLLQAERLPLQYNALNFRAPSAN